MINLTPTPNMAAEAMALIDRGLSVLPLCWPNATGKCACGGSLTKTPDGWQFAPHTGRDVGKAPVSRLVRNGLNDATRDPDVVREWWQKAPSANIGVRTGPESGIFVIDIDGDKGGFEMLAQLEHVEEPLPETITAITGGGGEHRLFAYPADVLLRNSAEKLGGGIDTRGAGGYIVAPPSLHISGRRYQWDAGAHPDEMQPASVPQWVIDRLFATVPTPETNAPPVAASVSEGSRNATLTSLGGSMRRRGMSENAIVAALLAENEARCVPPLSEDEVRKIARSVAKYAPEPERRNGASSPERTGNLALVPQPGNDTTPEPVGDDHGSAGNAGRGEPDVRPVNFDELPEIYVDDRQLADLSREALAAIVAANGTAGDSEDAPRLYVRGGLLVRVKRDEHGKMQLQEVNESALRGRMARTAQWLRHGKDDYPIAVHPPVAVVRDVLHLPEWDGLPALVNITESPVLRPDGTVLDTPGYDTATGLLYVPAADLNLRTVAPEPTAHEMLDALDLINVMLQDFPFADDASKANMIGLLITLVLRPAIAGHVPMALFDAPQAGTGKGLLSDLAAHIATGREAATMTQPKEDEEWRKRITATLMRGPAVVLIDNLEYRLETPHLASALTTGRWEDRELGSTRVVSVPQRAIWIGNGNNIRLGGDMPRRCYWIRINARMAHPWERQDFAIPDLRGWVRDNRGELLWALLTLCRGWHAAGCPEYNTPRMGSFEAWGRMVGGILGYYGLDGFLVNQSKMYDSGDDDAPQWAAFLTAWYETFGTTTRTVADVCAEIREGGNLRATLPEDLAGIVNNERVSLEKRLGQALRKRVDVRFDESGLYLERAGETRTKVAQWRVTV